MAESAHKLDAGPSVTGEQRRFRPTLPIVVLVYLIVWASTQAHFQADTSVYTQAILRHYYGAPEADYRSMTGNPFWDFGHILWRPFGWLCFRLAQPATQLIAHQNVRLEVLLTLFGINFLAGLISVALFFLLARRVIANDCLGNDWSAGIACVGFFCADAFLNYAHSGNAYGVGLCCLVSGMYLSWSEKWSEEPPRLGRALAAGALFALAVLFWLPYAFVLPAAFVAPLVLWAPDKQRQRLVIQTIIACAVVGFVVYGAATVALGIRNVSDLKQWILASGHGQIQPGGFRAVARLAFSVPRSFVNMDRDGTWLKRYLLHDPYAPVTMRRLFGLSLWKLALFYLSAGVVCFELLTSKRGRMLLFLTAATVLPIFVFAIFIFEAGSIERYLPLYPFVFLAFGCAWVSKRGQIASKLLLVVALAALCVVNVNAMRRDRLERRRTEAVARIQDLIPVLRPGSLVLAVNEQDSLAEFRQNFPLDPINVNTEWRTYDVLEINSERLATWKEDFARQVLATWRRGGAVWLPQRFLRLQPKPEWNWVEGDDRRIHWTDLPAFFSRFEVGPAIGGEDGFVFLQDSPSNRQLLEPLARRAQVQRSEHNSRESKSRELTLICPPRRSRGAGHGLTIDRNIHATPVKEGQSPVECA